VEFVQHKDDQWLSVEMVIESIFFILFIIYEFYIRFIRLWVYRLLFHRYLFTLFIDYCSILIFIYHYLLIIIPSLDLFVIVYRLLIHLDNYSPLFIEHYFILIIIRHCSSNIIPSWYLFIIVYRILVHLDLYLSLCIDHYSIFRFIRH
jgi:hypothetical protein